MLKSFGRVCHSMLLLVALVVTPQLSYADKPDQLNIVTLSSRPDTVSGGDVLVEVRLPAGATLGDLDVILNAHTAVTRAFGFDSAGRLVGLVKDLSLGRNELEARLRKGKGPKKASIDLMNHSRNGPIFSGPHQTPFICQTTEFVLPDGSTLGPPQDENCNAPTKVMYVYMPQGGSSFKPLASTTTLPADMGSTTTSDGKHVNYIVRLETGTVNRAIYQFAVLFDPTAESPPSPVTTYQGWNRKLVSMFGGSANPGYIQGNTTFNGPAPLNGQMLSQGYAVIASTLNVFGNNASDVLSAETASMVKEKFIKTFGVPIYTMGWGGSGGSMQQHLIAQDYPGVLDGITPAASFPDLFSIVPDTTDCSLLARAFASSSQIWTDAQKTAVSGFATWGICDNSTTLGWGQTFSPQWMLATATNIPIVHFPPPNGPIPVDFNNCSIAVPRSLTYNPVTNSNGARCDILAAISNQLAVDPSTGHSVRPWDNVGVQYGLNAFQSGAISVEQFVQLNELIGGYDSDGNFQAARTKASEIALNDMYEFGRINEGRNLGDVPIIDNRNYIDFVVPGNIHDSVRSMVTRARLTRANGNADNQVILRTAGPSLSAEVLQRMDEWLMNIKNDTKHHPSVAAKVVANKPAGFSDACYTATRQRIAEPADINNGGQCGQLMPFHANPRMAAGAPLTDDVLKCQLRAIKRSDYPSLSDSQYARLAAVFSSGVCDYSQPSVGFRPMEDTWLSYPTPGRAIPLSGRGHEDDDRDD